MAMDAFEPRVGNEHRWIFKQIHSITARQAGDIKRGMKVDLPVARRVVFTVCCVDCGAQYVSASSSQEQCLGVVR